MKKSTIIFLAIAGLFVASYVAYNLYIFTINDIDTQYALISEAYSTVEADCFIVRDESRGNGENTAIITDSGDGVYIPYVADGSRVAAGDIIALYFNSEKEAKAYTEKKALQEMLNYFIKLQNQSVLSMLDVDKLDKTINDNIVSIIEKTESNNYSAVSALVSSLKYDISAKDIATGKKLDFSKQITSLESEISALSSKSGNYQTIEASFPGCYISNVDGYESAVDYSKVASLTRKDVDSLINREAATVSSSAIGKIVDEYNWYAICNVPKESLEKLSVGKRTKVSFENTGVSMLEMKIVSISSVDDGYATIVLSSGEMNSDIALLRKEKIKIALDHYEGLRVPRAAIRKADEPDNSESEDLTAEDNLGVYILFGQEIQFRPINILYSGNDYVIVERGSSDKMLRLYDMIITKGRNLYDRKSIS